MKLKGDCFRFLLSVEDISVPYFDNLKYTARHYTAHNKALFEISACKFESAVTVHMYPTGD